MPMSIQPTIRAIQEVMETKGMYPTLDSQGVTVHKADVAAGKRTKQVPKISIVYLGTTTVPE